MKVVQKSEIDFFKRSCQQGFEKLLYLKTKACNKVLLRDRIDQDTHEKNITLKYIKWTDVHVTDILVKFRKEKYALSGAVNKLWCTARY